MKVVLFYHSFVSCWNHGNAHFLRGVARELLRLGHDVVVYEPDDGWSRRNALLDGSAPMLADASALVPGVVAHAYPADFELAAATDGADLVIVHEWNTPSLIARLGLQRIAGSRFTLLFHDTHHRFVTAPEEINARDLKGYDGVLAFGEALCERYRRAGWGDRAFVWHEAADTAVFHPLPEITKSSDVLWIGNWGDEERSLELAQYLINPIARLGLRARVHGVRYPENVIRMLGERGIEYSGWLPNERAPAAYAAARATIHIPRRPYVEALPGIPTIRVFEALACGIPLICSPWNDVEGLLPKDAFLTVYSEEEMTAALRLVLHDQELAAGMIGSGRRAISERHTCAHRVQELLHIADRLRTASPVMAAAHDGETRDVVP